MLLPQYSAPDYCVTNSEFAEGLAVLEENNLHWEWCCHYKAMPYVAQVCASKPNMNFVLDHLGRNGGTEDDIEEWKAAITLVAQNSNVVAKIGAIEEWGVANPAPILDFAIGLFGFGRIMFESNWFVSKAFGFSYEELLNTAKDACIRNEATDADLAAVFEKNAERVYRL